MWPEGCATVADVPWELAVALGHAYRILHWQENLMGDEMPPVWKWPFEDELAVHFERVQAAREAKYGGSGNDEEEGGIQNEYAERFKK